jgi:hypothetical protein
VLKISDRPEIKASLSASTQNTVSSVFESPKGQHVAPVPIEDGHQKHEARPHRDVGDVGAPHLAGTLLHHIAQEVRIHPVRGVGAARARPRRDPPKPHPAHQPLHPLAVHPIPLLTGTPSYARAVEGRAHARRCTASALDPPGSPAPARSSSLHGTAPAAHTGAGCRARDVQGLSTGVSSAETRSFLTHPSSIFSRPISS